MTAAIITSKGQITLPKDVRMKLGVETGDKVEFIETQTGGFTLIPATKDIRELRGIVKKPDKPVSIEEMNNTIRRKVAK